MPPEFIVNTRTEVKDWYQRKDIAHKYLKGKFSSPLGRLRHEINVETINLFLKKSKARNVLDLACGPARLTSELKGSFQGIAVDSSDEMLKIAKNRLKSNKWKIKKMDAFQVGKLNKKFSVITCFRFIRHFNNKERTKIYSELKHLMSKDSYLIFDAVNKRKWDSVRKISRFLGKKDIVKVYDKFYTHRELVGELNKNGLKVVKLVPVLNNYLIQYLFSFLGSFGYNLIHFTEKFRSNNPWEWVVICKLQ
jgi:ubiquinone/menaquinone biosynthesis C-methylase UbiE